MRDDRKERTSCQETTEARLEFEEPTSVDMKVCQGTTACQRATETDTGKIEPDLGMMQSIEELQEIPKGEAAVMPAGGLRKWRSVQNLAAERHQKRKGRTRGYYGSRKRVTIADRKMTRCTGMAWRRKNIFRKI
jgi:hypothetical protein